MDILKNITSKLEGKITEAGFEGANIVLYTDNEKFFKEGGGKIKEIVNEIKKRIELRANSKILLDTEKTEAKIKEIVPEEAEITSVIFDQQRSIVIIEAKKPGMVIGKQGFILDEIKKTTLWVPQVQRSPAIKSQIVEKCSKLKILLTIYCHQLKSKRRRMPNHNNFEKLERHTFQNKYEKF